MKVYKEKCGVATLNHKLWNKRSSVLTITHRPSKRRLNGPQIRFGHLENQKIYGHCRDSNPWLSSRDSALAIPTAQFRLPNFSRFKSLMISKFGLPQSVASIHSLQFLYSCPDVSIAVIFHGVSSNVIICGNRRFRFASTEESFAIMEMSMVRQPAGQPAICWPRRSAQPSGTNTRPSNEITIFTQVHKRLYRALWGRRS